MQSTCRFYKNRLPQADDFVLVKVISIGEFGVDVELPEYNHHPGMIPLAELSHSRIRSILKLISVGGEEVATVLRVNDGYIDLSKRRVSPEDIQKCHEKLARGKAVHSILRRTAELLNIQSNEELDELFERTAWFYDEKYQQTTAAYDVFVRAASDERELDDCELDETTRATLLNEIRLRLTATAVKYRADVAVTCFSYEGIDAVRAALRQGFQVSTALTPIKINLIASPVYTITTTCANAIQSIRALESAMNMIEQGITKSGGSFQVMMPPKASADLEEMEPQLKFDRQESFQWVET